MNSTPGKPQHKHCSRRSHSLTVRLTVVFLITGIVLVVLLIKAFHFAASERAHVHWKQVFINYVELISKDIRPPYTLEQTQSLSRAAQTKVSILNEQGEWIPEPPPFRLDTLDFHDSPSPEIKMTKYRGFFVLIQKHQNGGGTIVYYERPIKGMNFLSVGTLIMLGLMILVIYLCFHYVKSLLRPIQEVNAAANELRHGKFGSKVPVKREDELGQLAKTFNSMSARIKQMLDAKHQLLIALSHELRSPLTRIRMAGELLSEEEIREEIIQDAKLMECMIREIMEGEHLSEGHASLKTETISLRQIIQEVFDELDEAGKSRITVSASGQDRLFCDPVRVKIAIRNLIINSLKHSGKAPDADTIKNEDTIEVMWQVSPGQVRFSVKDHGPGFSAEDLKYAGEPFFKTDRARPHRSGSGMGLYLCKLIAEAHGGRLEVTSQPYKETIVSLIFPASDLK